MQSRALQGYLHRTDVVDWDHPDVLDLAYELGQGGDMLDVAERCFTWVRDRIAHSADVRRGPVTCRASEVLREGSGYCYAKSHLLAALLRANGIPAGFCYQRLRLDGEASPFCLHGLNAVLLPDHGWYRIDSRGNKPGVDARFTPPVERLAFALSLPGETDLPEIWPDPLPCVLEALGRHAAWDDLLADLPDVPLVPLVAVERRG